MTRIEFAVDHHPEHLGYGIIAITNGRAWPVGPQDFPSEHAAIAALLTAVGEAMKRLSG